MSTTPLADLAGYTILIVDDTPANLALVAGMLEQQGLRLAVAQDGEEALRRVAFASPDLILLDVMLPGIDGFEVCRRLKALPGPRGATPVIFMTALDGTADKVLGFAAGAVDYVTKPLQVEEVLARVATHLRLAAMQRQLAGQNAMLAEENRQRRQAQEELQRYRGSLEQLVVACTDELRDSERQFRTLAENSPDAIVRYNRALRRVYVNPAYLRLSGVDADELLAKPLAAHWNAEEPLAEYEDTLGRVLAGGGQASLNLSYQGARKRYHFAVLMVAERDAGGEICGVLAIGRDVTAQKLAACELASSYAQLRALEAHREGVREEERKRIARELHDELGQSLTALRMSTALLRVRFGERVEGLNEQVKAMTGLVDRTIAVVRDVSTMLRPGALDLGIGAALEWLADEFWRHSGVRCQLRLALGGGQLDERQATALFRIAQESLTNVARHAEASEVGLALELRQDRWHLQVADNGRGFEPRRRRGRSFGLAGIGERVHMLGGELALDSAPGGGTRVRVSLPLTPP